MKILIVFFFCKDQERTIMMDNVLFDNSNGNNLTVLFKIGLSGTASELSLIKKLNLMESLDEMVKSLKFLLQSQVSK